MRTRSQAEPNYLNPGEMECLHLSSPVDSKLFASVERKTGFACDVCQDQTSTWMCLMCGGFRCGRYVKGHSLEHYRKNKRHSVVIDCGTMATFCYECDDFTINDNLVPNLAKLREKLLAKLNDEESCLEASDSSNESSSGGGGKVAAGSGGGGSGDGSKKRHSSPNNIDDAPSTALGALENTAAVMAKKMKKDIKAVPRHLRSSGLRNLGNTCFMNAVLQSLSNLPHFCAYFKELPALDEKLGKGKAVRRIYHTRRNNYGDDILLSEEVRKILIELWAGSKTAISPDSLFNVIWKVVPRFRGFQQQDAHEFLCYILDRLHTELLNILPYLSHINIPYQLPATSGNAHTTNSSQQTAAASATLSTATTVSQTAGTAATAAATSNTPLVCDLQDCLKSFTELEVLSETELYHCGSCKKKQRSTKKFCIRRLPNVLCIHLKRFRWCNSYRQKVNTLVRFPVTGLDMSVYMLENMPETRGISASGNLYDLAAIIVHHGSGAGSGHYTAYAYNGGNWYHFNDSSVSIVEEETVRDCKAYILFYIRRMIKLPDMRLTQ